ncbi:MAG: KpsF/GutQ family sugar-phosphate isomerase [Candidatus Obscuribacter phosphatis]|uniref:KpsF/GutQ family sugar-phosphate isomerase n=1 Tax=Candidatus Obscuribacter phosphatis TaxID=1906157 RepID=A0A8J7PBQ9_9BACT|nr:KpsF/GutQ family sugar-phosphate isomerase [Candidatus Obscuribacter phosphatis]
MNQFDLEVGQVFSASPSDPDEAKPETVELSLIEYGAQVLQDEAEAILRIKDRLAPSFEHAIELLVECTGKVVVTGMGKSGHIATKIAATFASTGTPAFFVHPAELRHGDFGMLDSRDLVIALSSSGETQEIKLVLEPIKRTGLKLIALTGNMQSTLARYADVVLDVSVDKEACPLNLAPTSSTTAALAMGDALAMTLMAVKGIAPEDFARSHPGGSLGQKLITVESIMRSGVDVPIVSLNAAYEAVLEEITAKKLGFTAVCEDDGKLRGVITDGDLRRSISKYRESVFEKCARDIMTTSPKTISSQSLAVEALKLMEKYSIADLLIVDHATRPVGLIDLKDLLRAGVI